MESIIQTPVSTGRLWSGRIISWLPAIFLLIDGVWKLFKPALVVEATVKLGYSEKVIVPLGIVLMLFDWRSARKETAMVLKRGIRHQHTAI